MGIYIQYKTRNIRESVAKRQTRGRRRKKRQLSMHRREETVLLISTSYAECKVKQYLVKPVNVRLVRSGLYPQIQYTDSFSRRNIHNAA